MTLKLKHVAKKGKVTVTFTPTSGTPLTATART